MRLNSKRCLKRITVRIASKPHPLIPSPQERGQYFKKTKKKQFNFKIDMKKIASLSVVLLMSVIVGNAFASVLGVSAHYVVPALVGLSFIPTPTGVASFAVVKNSVIIAGLVQAFKDMTDDFLSPIKSMDDKVNNDVINFNEIGADPAVLINNTSYPIAATSRTDAGIPVSLFKLDTENTKITQDEAHALPYDKKSSVMISHRDALKRATLKLGAHSLAPAADSANTPVVSTTGVTVGTRKPMLIADIISLKKKLDDLEIPADGRYLVLSAQHVNDLLATDQAFRDRYYKTETGKMINSIYGFNIFESLHTPKYNGSTGAKKAYGAAGAASDVNASIFYHTQNAMKAMGSAEVYLAEAALDPFNRQTVVGMAMYYIVSPVSSKGVGAIIDTYVP
jgi:hypothetical protein